MVGFTGNVKDEKEVKDILKMYDWHTWAIDSYRQMLDTEAKNKRYLDKLKKLGVKTIYNDDFSVLGGKSYKKVIDLTK